MAPASIFFLASDLSPRGSARQLALIAEGLPRDRFLVEVGMLGSKETGIAGQLRAAGVPVHSLPIRHAMDIRGMRLLRRFIAAAKPAIVHAWGPAAVRAARLFSGPRIVASAASFLPSGIPGWLAARRLRQCDRVVAATWAEGERYRRLGVPGDRLTRISFGIEPPRHSLDRAALLAQLGMPEAARFIAAAGTLESASGFKSAIWAFDMVRYEYRDCHLVMFGDGPDRALLGEFGRALMFDDFRIHFAGNRTDLPKILEHADAVWVTHERGGVALALEAMAAGAPVVAWKTPDLAEVIEDGQTGFLVTPGDRAQLAAKTYPLLDDADLRTRSGDAGRQRVAEHFSAPRAIEQFARLYSEIMAMEARV